MEILFHTCLELVIKQYVDLSCLYMICLLLWQISHRKTGKNRFQLPYAGIIPIK